MYDTLGSPRTSCFALQRKQQYFSHQHFYNIAMQNSIKLWHSLSTPSSQMLKYNVLLSWYKLTPDSLIHCEISPTHQASVLYWGQQRKFWLQSRWKMGSKFWLPVVFCQTQRLVYIGKEDRQQFSQMQSLFQVQKLWIVTRLSGIFLFVWAFLLVCFFCFVGFQFPSQYSASFLLQGVWYEVTKKTFAIVFTC